MTTKDEPRNEVDSYLALLAGKFVSQPFETQDGGAVVFHGRELVPHAVAPLNPVLPEFVTQTETVVEPESFKQYLIDFKSDNAICRASLGQNKIEAVLDYHGNARMGEASAAVPGRGRHVVTLLCPYDLDYAAWKKVFDKPMLQTAFGNMLDDLIHTIHEPPLADLQEAIDTLQIERSVRFQSRVNRRNGNVTFAYEEVEEGSSAGTGEGGSVSLPEVVKIITPIFQGGPPVELVAKLRYRMEKGVVFFILTVPGLDKLERDHFRNIGEDVRSSTGTPVFYVP
jgi:hypothetical protein